MELLENKMNIKNFQRINDSGKIMKRGKIYNENPTMGPGDECLLCDTCLQYYFIDILYCTSYAR